MPTRYRECSLIELHRKCFTKEACARHLLEMMWTDGFRCSDVAMAKSCSSGREIFWNVKNID